MAIDAFFFDSYLRVQLKWIGPIDPWRLHAGLLTVLCVRSHFDVDDNSAASSFVHALFTCKHAGNSIVMRMRSVLKLAFLSVTGIHTYIPTQNEMRSRISCLALRRSANSLYDSECDVHYTTHCLLYQSYRMHALLYTIGQYAYGILKTAR